MLAFQRFRIAALAVLLLAAGSSLPAAAQFSNTPGFGNFLNRKRVEFHRKLPPLANMTGKSIGVTVEAQGALKSELQGSLESMLTRSDANVQVGGMHPDYVIACNVTMYAAPKLVTTKEGTVTTESFNGALSMSFRIGETGNGRIIHSGVASKQIDQPASTAHGGFHLNIPGMAQNNNAGEAHLTSAMDAENVMITAVARQVASYVVNTDEVVVAYLAVGGTLNGPDKLALSSLWTRNLEELETMTPFPDPKLDAYRLYNIGVANEALAYQAQDPKAAVKYLQEASIDYGKALSERADEKYFLEPQNRIKGALTHYDAPAPQPKDGARGVTGTAAAASHGVSNDDVIAMVQAKMDQANILDNIQSAAKVDFDLSVDGQVKLLHNGVNNQILAAMKQKARTAATPAGH